MTAHQRKQSIRIAGFLLAFAVTATMISTLIAAFGDVGLSMEDIAFVLAFESFSIVGWLILSARPGHPIGWLFSAIGALIALASATDAYSLLAIRHGFPAGAFTRWLQNLLWRPAFALLFVFLPLLFPDGRLPSRRWRPVAAISVLLIAVGTICSAFVPGPIGDKGAVNNPFGLAGARDLLVSIADVASTTSELLPLVGLIALVLRYRRSDDAARRQVKLFAAAVIAVLVLKLIEAVTNGTELTGMAGVGIILEIIATASVPVAVAVGVLRYRLWDLELVLNRTLVYGVMTAAVIAVYVAIVGGLGELAPGPPSSGSSLLATAIIAICFQPAAQRLQRRVDLFLYGERGNPRAVLGAVGRRMEATEDPAATLQALVETVHSTLRLSGVSLVAHDADGATSRATSGTVSEHADSFPMTFQSKPVGKLFVERRPGEAQLSKQERMMLEDLARQAGVAAHAAAIAEALRRSRQHIVTAREDERRRLRRDLHDGLGPRLAAVALGIEGAEARVTEGPLASTLASARRELQDAVADIRRLVNDLRPPNLDELGLCDAVRLLAESFSRHGSPIIVTVDAASLPPLPAAVELAAYRIIGEGITNVARHSGAAKCCVSIRLNEELLIEIRDDGCGISQTSIDGLGLRSMAERAEELGGRFVLDNNEGGGTVVRALLPMTAS